MLQCCNVARYVAMDTSSNNYTLPPLTENFLAENCSAQNFHLSKGVWGGRSPLSLTWGGLGGLCPPSLTWGGLRGFAPPASFIVVAPGSDDVRRRTSSYLDVRRRTLTHVDVRRRTSTYDDVRQIFTIFFCTWGQGTWSSRGTN